MPFDHAARAAQVGRIVDHPGDRLTWTPPDGGKAVEFGAIITPWTPTPTDADRNVGDNTSVLVKAARAVFGAKLPRQGQHFADCAYRTYRIQGLRSMPPTQPLIQFICGSVASPA